MYEEDITKRIGLNITIIRERQGLTQEKLSFAKDNVIVLHPGPLNREVEIDYQVADGHHSVILDQVTNGIAVRMAVLYLLFAAKG